MSKEDVIVLFQKKKRQQTHGGKKAVIQNYTLPDGMEEETCNKNNEFAKRRKRKRNIGVVAFANTIKSPHV